MNFDSIFQTGWAFFPEIIDDARRINAITLREDIRESLQILFTTLPGERLAHPLYGCDLLQFVFKPINNSLITDMRNTIETAIQLYETRILLIEVDIRVNKEINHRIDIDIIYELNKTNSRFNMTIPFFLMDQGVN